MTILRGLNTLPCVTEIHFTEMCVVMLKIYARGHKNCLLSLSVCLATQTEALSRSSNSFYRLPIIKDASPIGLGHVAFFISRIFEILDFKAIFFSIIRIDT